MSTQSNAPLFSLEREDGWRSSGLRAAGLRLVASGGGVVALVTSDGSLLRWDTDTSRGDGTAPPEGVEFPKGTRPEGSRITGVFVDPTGVHLLVAVVSAGVGITFYCAHPATAAAAGQRPVAKELSGLRGHVLSSVAWAPSLGSGSGGGDAATGPFLVGTGAGRVMLVRIEGRAVVEATRLWDASGGGDTSSLPATPVTSLSWDMIPDAGGGMRHLVLAVIAGGASGASLPRCLQFLSSATPSSSAGVRDAFVKSPLPLDCGVGGGSDGVTPSGAALSPEAVMSYGASGRPEGFALLGGSTHNTLITGSVLPSSSGSSSTDGVLTNVRRVVLPSLLGSSGGGRGGGGEGGQEGGWGSTSTTTSSSTLCPTSLALTRHHALLLYRSRLIALSRISPQGALAFEQSLPEDRHGIMRGLCVDTRIPSTSCLTPAPSSSQQQLGGGGGSKMQRFASPPPPPRLVALAFSDRHLYRVIAHDEGRDAWRQYLALGDFGAAKTLSEGNPSHLEAVWGAEAEALLRAGKGEAAADAFARTSRPFEETCLRFISGGHRGALGRYLSRRLDALREQGEEDVDVAATLAPQRSILCSWLLEQHLDALNTLEGPAAARGGAAALSFQRASAELRAFLRAAVRGGGVNGGGDLDRATALSLMSSHGRQPELLFYCRLVGEWSRIVAHHMARGAWQDALEAIRDAPASAPPHKKGRAWEGEEEDEEAAAAAEAEEEAQWRRGRADGNSSGDEEDDRYDASRGSVADRPRPGDPSSRQELWYKHSAILLPLLPAQVIEGWKRCPGLNPCRLIPTLVRYQQVRAMASACGGSVAAAGASAPQAPVAYSTKGGGGGANVNAAAAMRSAVATTLDASLLYLEWAVKTGRARAGRASIPVHNLLLTLYASLPSVGGASVASAAAGGVCGGDGCGEGPLLSYVESYTSRMPPAPPAGAAIGASSAIALGLAVGAAPSLMMLEEAASRADAARVAAAAAPVQGGGDGGEGEDEGEEMLPPFDLSYALRVTLPAGKPRTCVRLYCAQGLYVEAVEAALAVGDYALAKQAAIAPPADETDLRKRLWTRIAVSVIQRAVSGGSVPSASGAGAGVATPSGPSPAAAAAIEILRESGCLRIEDVLVYFPGSMRLEDFKGEVTAALREADADIRRLRLEMRGYTQAAERIRCDIKALRTRCATVRIGQRCEQCRAPVLSRHMYALPCGHAFHADCLTAAVIDSLTAGQRRRVGELTTLLGRVNGALSLLAEGGPPALAAIAPDLEGVFGGSGGGIHPLLEARASASEVRAALSARAEAVQGELDALVAGQCLLCGDALVDTITEPFEAGGEEWEV